MGFKDNNPKWKLYYNPAKSMQTIPREAFSELHGLIRRAANDSNELKAILNGFSELIPCEPTQNWGWSFLEQDIALFVNALESKVSRGRLPSFMDCLALLIETGNITRSDSND